MTDKKIWDKVDLAIEAIKSGACNRVDVNEEIKVYRVKDTLRIDINEK